MSKKNQKFVYAGKNASSPSYLGSVNGDQDKVYSFTAKEPGDYYWKVVMFENSQASYTSPIWHFNINSIANPILVDMPLQEKQPYRN